MSDQEIAIPRRPRGESLNDAVKPYVSMSTPPTRPVVGHYGTMRSDPLHNLQNVSRTYGDIVRLRVGRIPIVLVNHPDLIERILVTEQKSFIKPALLHRAEETLGKGLLTSEGDFWLRQRRLASPAFHKRKIEGYATSMVERTRERIAGWNEGEIVDVHQQMMALTLEIVTDALFGSSIDEKLIDEVHDILEIALDRFMQYQTMMGMLFDWIPRPRKRRFFSALARLDEIIMEIIESHRAKGIDPDDDATLLGTYLSMRDDEGKGMSDRQLRDECVTLFLAGHETTASALSFAFYLLSQNPEALGKLHEEIDTVIGDRVPSSADYMQLPYTRKVFAETLRLYPPAWRVGRENLVDVTLGGYRIPAGTQFFASQWSVHRDERWFEEPEAFRPERWTEEFERSRPRYAYFPYGGGPRLCIGSGFADMEGALIIATVVQSFRLTYRGEIPPALYPSITLRPVNGMRMAISRRNGL